MSSIVRICCPNCFVVNRVPSDRLPESPKCGQCHQKLFTGVPVSLNASGFESMMSRNDIPVLIDFWADWCGPCIQMSPEYAKACESLEPHIRVCKIDTQAEQALSSQFDIRGIPALLLFVSGEEIARSAGFMTAGKIVEFAKKSVSDKHGN